MMTVIIFILILGLLVLVHELGHFMAAKKAGCKVEEFGIGFPPKLFSIKRGETEYKINLLPLGGYVKIKGENGEETDDPRSFVNKSFAWKSLIVSAGVLMNVLLAFVLITIGLAIGVPAVTSSDQDFGKYAVISDAQIQVVEVLPDSPAEVAGILPGDIILSVNDAEVITTDQLSSSLLVADNSAVSIVIQRSGEDISLEAIPSTISEIDRKGIGVSLAETATVSYPWYLAPFYGLQRTWNLLILIIGGFAALINRIFSGAGVGADVAGPIGIAVMTGEVAELGLIYLMQFTALLSLNLAIINIIPFPALDGGRLALIILEKIRRKKLNFHIENWIHILGFASLMILIVVITAKDISTYGSGIWQSIASLFR